MVPIAVGVADGEAVVVEQGFHLLGIDEAEGAVLGLHPLLAIFLPATVDGVVDGLTQRVVALRGGDVDSAPLLVLEAAPGDFGGPLAIRRGEVQQAAVARVARLEREEAVRREVPDGVPDDAVALVDAFAVGEYYVRASGIMPGDLPIVVGAGAVGLSAVAALERRGIDPVLVSDLSAERRDLAREFGAEVLVDPAVRPLFEVWREVAAERGVTTPPFVFECVGAPGLVQQLVETCEMWTRIYVAGAWYTDDTINCTDAARRGVTLQFGGGPLPDDWWATFEAVCEGRLDPLPSVGRVIGLEDVPDALDLARRADGPPRIVVHPFAGAR